MTCGEKIRYYRKSMNMSLEELGKLSGIYPDTIKKYEHGQRNPKPDQLQKIAWALGISVYFLMDLEIETVSDVLAILYHLDRQVDMIAEGIPSEELSFAPGSVSFRFLNQDLVKNVEMAVGAKQTADTFRQSGSDAGKGAADIFNKQILELLHYPKKISKGTQGNIMIGPHGEEVDMDAVPEGDTGTSETGENRSQNEE